MYNPNPRDQRLWMHHGARLGGIVVAGRCILVFMFFGFGLMLMGIIAIATSSGFDNFGGKGVNPPRTVGICFLSIGGSLFVLGIIFLFVAKRAVNQMSQGNQDANATNVVCPPPGPVLAGGGPYTPVPTNPYQPYPPNQYSQPPTNQYPPNQYSQPPTNQYPPNQYQQPPTSQYPPNQPQQPPTNQYPPQPGGPYQPQPSYAPNYVDPKGQSGLPYPAHSTSPPSDAPPAYHM